MVVKNKRQPAMLASPENSPGSGAAESSPGQATPPPPVPTVDECPYKIVYHTASGKAASLFKKKRGRSKAGKAALRETDKNPIEDADTAWSVDTVGKHKDWETLTKYKNFVVGTETFSVNDFVFINHTNIPHSTELANIDDKDFWVARVLEIRAKDEAHVYLRVYWMYWPDELPNKRQSYHGARELLASNHMEIVDAMTVSGRAHVTHWLELDEEEDIPGLFWRQKFDWPTSQLSELRTHCRCHKHYNPDSLLVNCSACGVWLHAECVIDDIKTRVLERGGPPEEQVVNKEDSIAVAKPAPPPTKRKGAKTLFSSAVESFVPVNPLEAPETPKAEKNAIAPETPKAEKTTAAPETPKAEKTTTAPPMSTKKRSAKEMKSEKEKIKVTYNDTTSKAHVRDLRGTAEAATPGKRRKGPAGSAAPAPLGEAKEWDEEVKCLCCGAVVV